MYTPQSKAYLLTQSGLIFSTRCRDRVILSKSCNSIGSSEATRPRFRVSEYFDKYFYFLGFFVEQISKNPLYMYVRTPMSKTIWIWEDYCTFGCVWHCSYQHMYTTVNFFCFFLQISIVVAYQLYTFCLLLSLE